MLDRIDTSNMPRFVLDPDKALAFLTDNAAAVAAQLSQPNGLRMLLADAQRAHAIAGPDGFALAVESNTTHRVHRFMVDGGASSVMLAGMWISERQTAPAGTPAMEALEFLAAAVDEGNTMLRNLVYSATLLVASLSTDPMLLTRLADGNDPDVRAAAAGNPAAPDEARVLAALRNRAV